MTTTSSLVFVWKAVSSRERGEDIGAFFKLVRDLPIKNVLSLDMNELQAQYGAFINYAWRPSDISDQCAEKKEGSTRSIITFVRMYSGKKQWIV